MTSGRAASATSARSRGSQPSTQGTNPRQDILGAAILSVPAGERDALLPMLHERISERDQAFVTQCLADGQLKEIPAVDET